MPPDTPATSLTVEEPLKPGEVDLDGDLDTSAVSPEAPAADDTAAAVETVEDVVEDDSPNADDAVVEEPAAEGAPPKLTLEQQIEEVESGRRSVRPGSMLHQLITNRQAAKEAKRELARLQEEQRRAGQPTAQQIEEARQRTEAAQQQALKDVAEELGLFYVDDDGRKVYDLEAARKTDALLTRKMRAELDRALAPQREQAVRQAAQGNLDKVNAHLQATKVPAAAARHIMSAFINIAQTPNGAQMLADKVFAERLWFNAYGEAAAAGMLNGYVPPAQGAQPPPTQQPGAPGRKPAAPPVIDAPSTGRRPAAPAVQLSARQRAIYKEHGINPDAAATRKPTLGFGQGADLE